MLILARRMGEKILIGKDITIKVLDMKFGQVRLGIEAPRELPVHREEIFQCRPAEEEEKLRTEM